MRKVPAEVVIKITAHKIITSILDKNGAVIDTGSMRREADGGYHSTMAECFQATDLENFMDTVETFDTVEVACHLADFEDGTHPDLKT